MVTLAIPHLAPQGWYLCIVYAAEDLLKVRGHHHQSLDSLF